MEPTTDHTSNGPPVGSLPAANPRRPAATRYPRLGWTGRFVVFGIWTFLAILESSKAYLTSQLRELPIPIEYILIGNFPWWYFWALLTPAALWIGRRFPLDGVPRARVIGVHLVAAFVLSCIHLGLTGALYWRTNTRVILAVPSATEQIRRFFDNYLFLDLLTYAAIIGAYFAFSFYHRFREEEIATTRLQLHAARLESTMNQAQLDALRMELNPHFLFNTLNAISGLVRRRENDAAVRMLARLGDLLRLTLERGAAQEVPLDTELAYLQGYLDIEQIRFHDRLTVDMRIADDTLGALVPTLILQPLVENAVRHGIALSPGPGRVSVTAVRSNGDLVIDIEDTGAGFRSTRPDGRTGVGLTNTRSRLERLYGPRGRLQLGAGTAGGALVSIVMPFRTGEEDQNG
jgi:two-component system, LytTR family, sensor kinase